MATITENIQTLRSIKSGIKQAITDKGGSVGNDFKTYAQAITDLPSGGGGGTEIEDGLVTRTLSVYSNDRVSVVGDYAFYNYRSLTSVSLLNCKLVSTNAFFLCSRLQSIDLPNCIEVGNYAFASCYNIKTFNLPNCETVYSYGFNRCSGLTSIELPLCIEIRNSAFTGCRNLIEVYLNSVPNVTRIQLNTFSSCSNLTSIYVPASLVDAFKTAQYWSSLSTKIVAYGKDIAPED